MEKGKELNLFRIGFSTIVDMSGCLAKRIERRSVDVLYAAQLAALFHLYDSVSGGERKILQITTSGVLCTNYTFL